MRRGTDGVSEIGSSLVVGVAAELPTVPIKIGFVLLGKQGLFRAVPLFLKGHSDINQGTTL